MTERQFQVLKRQWFPESAKWDKAIENKKSQAVTAAISYYHQEVDCTLRELAAYFGLKQTFITEKAA